MSEAPPPDPSALLRLLRDDPPAPADARARVRARLGPTVLGGGGGGTPAGGASGGGRDGAVAKGGAGGALGRALTGRGLAVVTFVVGAGVGAALHAALTREPAPRVVIQETVAAAHVPAPPVAAPVAVDELDDVPAPAATATAQAPHPSSSAPGPSQLAAERAALDEVRALLVQGEPASALDRLHRAARRFPHPVLGEERDALTIEALVGVHRYDEARARANAFHERAPGSLFTATVTSAIRSIPAETGGAADDGGEP